MFKKLFDYFLFTSLFIAGCALLMVYQATRLLQLQYDSTGYLLFVFFSTLCSYNFHWYLTPGMETENIRVKWTQQHKTLHLLLAMTGLIGSVIFFFHFIQHWFWLGGAVFLTFLYSAPKLRVGPFSLLKKIAIGKTLFLAFVWTYVTTFLPIAFDNRHWNSLSTIFCVQRFLLIYAICILFDYRDREHDRKEGVRSMITYFNEKGINILFYCSLLLFALASIALYLYGIPATVIIYLLVPGIILRILYPVAKRNFSDYLYYFVLDGLMMFSAIFTALFPF